jgi:hypothetical protein
VVSIMTITPRRWFARCGIQVILARSSAEFATVVRRNYAENRRINVSLLSAGPKPSSLKISSITPAEASP